MFIPAALPPDPPLELNGDTINLLSEADIALGRLDGVAEFAPNPNLFLTMYVRKEAVMSSQIEGTQATLLDVLKFEAERGEGDTQAEIGEVVSYVAAINYGLSRLAQLPLSLRLIKETHARLMQDSRGSARDPGEFRRIQNWIGSGADILMKIDMVGNNLQRAQGMCGSVSGSIPADVGQPTIRVSEILVGGRGGVLK